MKKYKEIIITIHTGKKPVFGTVYDELDFLKKFVTKYIVLKKIFEKDIQYLTNYIEEFENLEYQNYLEHEDEKENHNGCIDCPWGNGEGGCTIGYCDVYLGD